MGFGIPKRKDNLAEEFRMLPSETKKRILSNVNKRKAEILEGKMLERELKEYKFDRKDKKNRSGNFREGMLKRRKELTDVGIIQPIIRVNKQNFQSPLEALALKNRQKEIEGYENQRDKLKSGCVLGENKQLKAKDLKLKVPKLDLVDNKTRKRLKQNGFI